jgi:hypothetical protein
MSLYGMWTTTCDQALHATSRHAHDERAALQTARQAGID